GVEYVATNVLESAAVRDGIKQYTNWPTIPQLYVKGEFIGGCDILKEMFENGELKELLSEKGIELAAE
ncbi:MAG: monothiol glutaredoxin, Grx4 family, partial [Alphaproteobacteria bacterium]|nr:monothiol glutaredoxin, Grx4 family [Alphaproteobacteria bacterium]